MAAAADEQLRQFVSNEDDPRRNSLPRAAVKGAAAAAGAAYGAGKLRNAVINKAGAVDDYGNLVARKGMWKSAAKSWANPLKDAGKKILEKGSGFLGKAAKAFDRKDIDRFVDLAARVAELELEHEFGEPEKQRSKLGMYAAAGPFGLYEQGRYKRSGLVYRKRDGLVDGVKGSAAGYATTAGLLGAGAGLGKLAASGKLPKGMIRKGAVKSAQLLKRNPLTAGVGAGVAGVGSMMAVAHGSADKRRKALLKQRLQGGQASEMAAIIDSVREFAVPPAFLKKKKAKAMAKAPAAGGC